MQSVLAAVLLLAAAVAIAQQAVPQVTVVQPRAAEVSDWREYPGRFRAVRQAEIFARVDGHVEAVAFREGAAVADGDLLFALDRRQFRAARELAAAELRRAESRQALARVELSRLQRLLAQEAVSQEQVDIQAAELDVTAADVDAAAARLSAARIDLEFTHVRAPFAGRVSSRGVDPGDLVRAGETLLTTLVAAQPIHLVFDISEADYLATFSSGDRFATPGFEVAVRLLDEQRWTRAGPVEFVDNRLDSAAATLRLRATLENADGRLLPGTFARVRMPVSAPYPALLVPDQALLADHDRRLVLVVADDGSVQPQPVTLGSLFEGLRVIRSGLDHEARVIVEGHLAARAAGRATFEQLRSPDEFASADGTRR